VLTALQISSLVSCRRDGEISYLSIRSSASTHLPARPALADPPTVSPRRGACSPRRGACSRRRGACSRRGSTLPPTLPSLLAGGTCLLNSELLSSRLMLPSQPPPAFTAAALLRLPPPACLSVARSGRRRTGRRRSVLRWRSHRSIRRLALGVCRAAHHSPSAAVWRSNRTNISRPSRL
jgi:hypothetical protein